MSKYVKYNMTIAKEVHQRIQKMAKDTNADSVAAVIRRSLAVYKLLIEAGQSGGVTLVRYPDGKESIVELIPEAKPLADSNA